MIRVRMFNSIMLLWMYKIRLRAMRLLWLYKIRLRAMRLWGLDTEGRCAFPGLFEGRCTSAAVQDPPSGDPLVNFQGCVNMCV